MLHYPPTYTKRRPTGFSLMEVLVSLFVIMILMLGIYSLIILSLKLTADNKFYVEATAIANQQMEQIRNMPYDDVGTVAGTVTGPIPDNQIVVRDAAYNVHTVVAFVDDPYDGTVATTDTVFTDYKIATVEVSWEGKFGPKDVTVFSKIIPNTEEVWAGYGLLKLLINDSTGAPVPFADIHLENNNLATPVSVDYNADASGELSVPVLPDLVGWEVTVTLPGYGTDGTYDTDAGNPNPAKAHLSVFDGLKTEDAFTIDRLSSLTINTVGNSLPDNWQVNQILSTRQHSQVSQDLDGFDNIYLAWQSTTATSSHIYVQKYNAGGTAQWAADKKISTTQFQRNPDIATRANGDSFVVWQDNSAVLKATARSPWQRLVFNDFKLSLNSEGFYSTPLKIDRPIYNFDGFWPKIARAAVPATIVQEEINGPYFYDNDMSETYSSPPTEGNVLIVVAELRNPYCSFNAPSTGSGPFVEAVLSDPASGFGMDIGIWYRVAEAGEDDTVTIDTAGGCDLRGGAIVIYEVAGLDTGDLLDQVSANDQTSWNDTEAHTGSTGITTDNGFAIAALSFGDDDFNTPNSSNYASISGNSWSQQFWGHFFASGYPSGYHDHDASLAIATMHIDSAAAQRCTLTLSGGLSEQRNSVMAVFNLENPENATLDAAGSQIVNTAIPAVDTYLGGTFVLTENTSSRSITDITISENGSIHAQDDLANVRLYYDLDTSAPYDCAGESYDAGADPMFGAATTFDAADGRAVFNEVGGVTIDTAQTMCFYVVADVLDSASAHDLIDIFIDDPSVDISADVGTILPAGTNIEITGSTEIQTPAELEQAHYRWRDDDGDEASAGWLEPQDNPYTVNDDLVRLRLAVSNEGSLDSASTQFRLEYAESAGSCSAAGAWTALPTDLSAHWQIVDSANLNDDDPTTNFAGSLSDPNSTFVPGYTKDSSNLTPAMVLGDYEFTEIEYSLKATSNANDSTYCFRLSNDGDTSEFTYTYYPQISIIGDDNVYIISLDANGNENWAVNKLNSDSGDAEQSQPRIAFTESGGTATTAAVWVDDRNGNLDIYAQSTDGSGNDNWAGEIQITTSAGDEYNPDVIFDSNENIYIAWEASAGSLDVYLHKYDMEGNPLWGSPVAVAATLDDESDPKLAADASGNVYISWGQNESGTFNVYVAKYDSAGTEQWRVNPNIDAAGNDQKLPAIYARGAELAVAWDDYREGNDDIYTQILDLNGNRQWSEDVRANVNTGTSTQSAAAVLINSTGDYYAAWQDGRHSSVGDIYAAEFFATGALTPVPNVALNIRGTKKIGLNPVIYEFDINDTTDGSGQLIVPLEWDSPGYSVNLQAASPYTIIKREPVQPLNMPANSNLTMTVYVE